MKFTKMALHESRTFQGMPSYYRSGPLIIDPTRYFAYPLHLIFGGSLSVISGYCIAGSISRWKRVRYPALR